MHPLSHRARLAMCRLVLALMLFGHFAFAAQACVLPAMSPAAAVAADAASDPCHDTDDNLCLTQCLQRDETLDSHPGLAVPILSAPVIVAAPAIHAITPQANCDTYRTHTGPPFYLQMCRLLC